MNDWLTDTLSLSLLVAAVAAANYRLANISSSLSRRVRHGAVQSPAALVAVAAANVGADADADADAAA